MKNSTGGRAVKFHLPIQFLSARSVTAMRIRRGTHSGVKTNDAAGGYRLHQVSVPVDERVCVEESDCAASRGDRGVAESGEVMSNLQCIGKTPEGQCRNVSPTDPPYPEHPNWPYLCPNCANAAPRKGSANSTGIVMERSKTGIIVKSLSHFLLVFMVSTM